MLHGNFTGASEDERSLEYTQKPLKPAGAGEDHAVYVLGGCARIDKEVAADVHTGAGGCQIIEDDEKYQMMVREEPAPYGTKTAKEDKRNKGKGSMR